MRPEIAVGGDLWADVSGTGPDLVLLHSLALNSRVWDPIAERYASVFRAIRPDFPGHGESGYDGRALTVFDLADGVVGVLDRLGVGQADVIGVSLGGSVAMALGLRHPERLRRLVLADCSADYGPQRVAYWAERAHQAVAVPRTEQFARTKERWFSGGFLRTRPDVIARFEAMFVDCDSAAHAETCRALGALNLLDELPAIAAQTLVAVGGDDPGTPVSMAEAIAARIPGARLDIVPGARHMALFECEDVWDAILDHLRSAS
jgi:3-oxoadipate enol-lactonase